MKRLTKIMAIVAVASTIFYSPVFAATQAEIPISVTIGLMGSGSLDAKVRNISGNAEAANFVFNLTNINAQDPATYWKIPDQYVNITYNCTWNATYGIRIYTDNKTTYPTMVGTPLDSGLDGIWGTADDKLTYAGLVHTTKLTNPTYRAQLGWQVYKDKIAGDAKPAIPQDADYNNGTPLDNTDDWNAAWAYITDKTGTPLADFNKISWYMDSNGNGRQDISSDPLVNEPTIFNYNLILFGGIGEGLAQHPPVTVKPGDGDIAVYLSAKFVSTDYTIDPVNGTKFVLPAGSYSSKIYLELINE